MKLLLLSRRTFKNLDNINNTDFCYIAMLKWKLEFFTSLFFTKCQQKTYK